MIGIGARDGEYGINIFKKTFKIAFPLFPDEDLTIYTKFGSPNTPYFICIQLGPGEETKIILTYLGKIPPAGEFIRQIAEIARIES